MGRGLWGPGRSHRGQEGAQAGLWISMFHSGPGNPEGGSSRTLGLVVALPPAQVCDEQR